MILPDEGDGGAADFPPPRPQERLLIDALDELPGARVLCTTSGFAQLALTAARQPSRTTVHCHFLDLYHLLEARRRMAGAPPTLAMECAEDFPATEFDLAALPFSSSGEAELVLDRLQAAHQRLRIGGTLAASTENPRDSWLLEQIRRLFGKVNRRQAEHGTLYLATKAGPLKKVKDFACEFAFRDRGRLIRATSRPGVFAHRRVDAGARQLLNAMEIEPGWRAIDIGCGSGVVALAAALRAEGVHVHAVDSNARAVASTARGAVLNGITTLTAELNATGDYQGRGLHQVALANPPYYSGFRIARHFLLEARAALAPGGRIFVVTKDPGWYAERMPEWYDDVEIRGSKDYHVATGRKRPD